MRNLASSFTMRKDGVLPRGDWFRIENKKAAEADIYIYDEIGFWGTDAADFVKELQKLDASTFNVHINSPGGEIFDGLAIYNSLKQHKATINIFVDGLAASAASFIAQAGDTVTVARNAQMMIHDGIAMAYGNEKDMRDTADLLATLSNNIADIYHQAAKRRGTLDNSMEYFRGLMKAETWMNGGEAVDLGLADVVTDQDDEEAEKASNKWDLSFYNFAGRDKAESPLRVQEKIRLANQQKETEMAGEASDTTDPAVTPAAVPDTTPPTETRPAPDEDPAPAPEQPETSEPENAGPGTGTPTPPSPPPTPTPPTPPANAAQGVMINGKLETDYTVINRHYTALDTAARERETVFRNEFVEQLATDHKIGAPMIPEMQKHVQSLTAEQFASFQALYGSSAPSSLFDQNATRGDGDDPQSPESASIPGSPQAKKERIADLESMVAILRRQMPEESVLKTNSYKELLQLQGTSTNES